MNEAIAATGFLAVARTGIDARDIAIVTGFTGLDFAVTTHRFKAESSGPFAVPASGAITVGITISCFAEIRLGACCDKHHE